MSLLPGDFCAAPFVCSIHGGASRQLEQRALLPRQAPNSRTRRPILLEPPQFRAPKLPANRLTSAPSVGFHSFNAPRQIVCRAACDEGAGAGCRMGSETIIFIRRKLYDGYRYAPSLPTCRPGPYFRLRRLLLFNPTDFFTAEAVQEVNVLALPAVQNRNEPRGAAAVITSMMLGRLAPQSLTRA